jgi:uncharacterized membrane protein
MLPIQDGFGYITILILISSCIVYIQHKTKSKIFDYLPAIVIIYFAVMILSTYGLWQKTPQITATYKAFKSHLLPAMIFLMLLMGDIRDIYKLGFKMILTFFLASVSIAIGFIGSFMIFKGYFDASAYKSFGALCGSWMGGSGNMVAIQGALGVDDSAMGYVLLIDSIDYAIWVMILLALVPFAKAFNHWSRSDSTIIDTVGAKLLLKQTKEPMSFESLFLLLGISLGISYGSDILANLMPTTSYLTHTTWIVIYATIFGIVGAFTPLSKIPGAMSLGNMMLYFIVALIASRANFAELTQAPTYILAGFVIILIHAVLMVIFAKIFRLDLFSIGVASLANIGGVASAPILASAYSKALIPIGVLMAMLGYIIGTFGGLIVARVLEIIA